MKLLIKDALFFKLFDALKSVISSAIFLNVYNNYLEIKQMNVLHTCLINIKIDSNLFEDYIVDSEETLAIPCEPFLDALKMFSKSSGTLIESGEKDGGLVLALSSPTRRGAKKTYIKLFSPDEWEPPGPLDIDHLAVVRIDAGDFLDALKDASTFNTEVFLESTAEDFTVTSSGDLGGHSEIWKLGDNMVSLFQEPAKCLFDTSLLASCANLGKAISENVQISLGDGVPVKLAYLHPKVMCVFFIAAMIV